MKERCEYEIRLNAIRIYEETGRFGHAVESVHRSRGWLSKWLRRYRKFGLAGLRDQSRVPKHIPHQTPESLVRKILALRDELAAHKTRRTAFAGIGAKTIHHELHDRGVRHLPVISTIEKILARAGKTKKVKVKRTPGGPPYPYVRARKMADLQQTDLVGPRYLRGPRGITRFYSFHTIDVIGQTVSASQFPDKQTISLCRHLVDSWRSMGLPRVAQMDNEMSASGGGRYRHSLSQVIRLHLLFGIHLVFIPKGEPGRNATVESFNNTWQIRVLRHRCANLRAVRRCSDRFLEYYHVRKPSRSLTVADHGTRLPGVLRDQLWATLRHLPIGFTIDPYFDARGHPALPFAKGLVSWVRKVDAHALATLYQAARLYVNHFQPSFKLREKEKIASKVKRYYEKPKTPCERLLSHPAMPSDVKEKLEWQGKSIDPVDLLHRIRQQQAVLACRDTSTAGPGRESLGQFMKQLGELWRQGEVRAIHRTSPKKAHYWRTRKDPFESVWPDILLWFHDAPDATAKELFERLQEEQPGRFPDVQLRTLQRRVRTWRHVMARGLVYGGLNAPDLPSDVTPIGLDRAPILR